MAVTIRDLIESKKEYFDLSMLAGVRGLDYTCTWVHMVEDITVADFFWGNELVVTSGYLMRTEEEILENVKAIHMKNCAGILFNIGPYVRSLPESVINFCEEVGCPLFVMPWEKSMMEFVREACSQITRSIVDEERLGNSVMHMVRFPEDNGENFGILSNYFHEEEGFRFLAMNIKIEETQNKHRIGQRIQLRIDTAMRQFAIPYLLFKEGKYWILVLNTQSLEDARSVGEEIRKRIASRLTILDIHIGVGEAVHHISRFNFAYQSASAARRQGMLKKEFLTDFQHMGFLKLLYTITDDAILRNYYKEVMDPILEYERKSNKDGIYVETLFRYLLEDGSLQRVAKAMYVHENTIYYRMSKIREVLNNPLSTREERQPVLMAYYCGMILRIIPDYERE